MQFLAVLVSLFFSLVATGDNGHYYRAKGQSKIYITVHDSLVDIKLTFLSYTVLDAKDVPFQMVEAEEPPYAITLDADALAAPIAAANSNFFTKPVTGELIASGVVVTYHPDGVKDPVPTLRVTVTNAARNKVLDVNALLQ